MTERVVKRKVQGKDSVLVPLQFPQPFVTCFSLFEEL
jgi:hypothetical protein